MSNEAKTMVEAARESNYDSFFESFDSFVNRVVMESVVGTAQVNEEYDDKKTDDKAPADGKETKKGGDKKDATKKKDEVDPDENADDED